MVTRFAFLHLSELRSTNRVGSFKNHNQVTRSSRAIQLNVLSGMCFNGIYKNLFPCFRAAM